MPEVDVTPFSPTMRRLVRALGLNGALRLLRWRGGRRLCVPRDAESTELTQYLDVDQVHALIATFGAGMWITLPKPDQLHIAARNRKIRAERIEGATLADLSSRYGLTTRHITNIVGSDDDERAEPLKQGSADLSGLGK